MRESRKKMTMEQKERTKILARERQRRRRERLKYETIQTKSVPIQKSPSTPKQTTPKPVKPKTRAETEHLRLYWAEKQRLHRARMSSQKLRRKREKDRVYRMNLKLLKSKSPNNREKLVHNMQVEPRIQSKDAIRKAKSRVKMPQNPQAFANVIEDLILKATPRKVKALNNLGIIISPKKIVKKKLFMSLTLQNIREKWNSLKGPENNKIKERRIIASCIGKLLNGYKMGRTASTVLGINRSYFAQIANKTGNIKQWARKERSDTISHQTKQNVQEFYNLGSVSREIPTKKSVLGRKNLNSRVLETSLKRAYKDYLKMYSNDISFSAFTKLRPINVKLLDNTSLEQCLCEKCQNIELKLKALNIISAKKSINVNLVDRFSLVNKTLCKKNNKKFHDIGCIQRLCKTCGIKQLKEFLSPLTQLHQADQVKWHMWDRCTELINGKSITKKTLVTKLSTIQDFVEQLCVTTKDLACHLFVARWQQTQFHFASTNIPDGVVVMVLDFGENYVCSQQDEVQSAHWSQNTVTIHPIVAYYRCPKNCAL